MHFELTYLGTDRLRPVKQHVKKDEVSLYASIVADDDTITRAFIMLGNTIVWSKSWDPRISLEKEKILVYLETYTSHKRY